ncbi:MAG: hypothetical protein QOH68_1079 [Nocardioidaceae bacterium]|jgi:hypothetical protein|nr:hypothetical protein [Nocardioidaceae bacterium]
MNHRHLVPAALLGLALTLAGCGGSDDGKDTSKPSGSSDKASPTAAAGGDFCAELKSNGATGASFGPAEIYLPKDKLVKQVDGALAVMGDATPPDALAGDWKVRKDYLTGLKAAADKLPDGGTLHDPAAAGDETTIAASKKITDYWFATCAG